MASATTDTFGQTLQSLHEFLTESKDTNLLLNREFQELLKTLRDLLKDEIHRDKWNEDIISGLGSLLKISSDSCEGGLNHHQVALQCACISEIFRCFRNSCANCSKNQDLLQRHPVIFDTAVTLIAKICERWKSVSEGTGSEALLTALKCGIQFLGNAVTGHENNQAVLWSCFFPQCRFLLQSPDMTVGTYTSMVIYNCLSGERITDVIENKHGPDILVSLMNLFTNNNSEWSWYILEKLFQHPGLLVNVYKMLDIDKRLQLIQMLTSSIQQLSDTGGSVTPATPPVAMENINCVSADFIDNAHTILGLSQQRSVDSLEPVLVCCELDLLCEAASHPAVFPLLQEEERLLKSVINLLHCVQMIGEEGDNMFSIINKAECDSDLDTSHPAFGLRKDLIRLLANMAYKHKENQNKIRDLGGLKLILDHTNIDGRNPYISQWSVLAIRNLCDENIENQRFIASLNLEGVSNAQQIQDQLGIIVEKQGDKVVIKKKDNSKDNPQR